MLRTKSTVGTGLSSAASARDLDSGFLWRHPQSLDELWNLTTTVILVTILWDMGMMQSEPCCFWALFLLMATIYSAWKQPAAFPTGQMYSQGKDVGRTYP